MRPEERSTERSALERIARGFAVVCLLAVAIVAAIVFAHVQGGEPQLAAALMDPENATRPAQQIAPQTTPAVAPLPSIPPLPSVPPLPIPRPQPDPVAPQAEVTAKVTLVRVAKAERRLELVAGRDVVRTYSIALGGNPLGHKEQEGDSRTPEGRYTLDWRNPNSLYYRSIHVSYPNASDRKAARKRGVSPGGDIMIHGQPKAWPLWSTGIPSDWTLGCIAVANEHMAEIWKLVEDGTPIEINP